MRFELSIANIEFLKQEISNSGLTYSHLRDDLIDHVCCDIETEMQKGLPFEEAYELVNEKIGMGGLERIQHETLYLIDKKYRIMKMTMKISGVIAPIVLAFGTLFKIMHWPAAGILILIGFVVLSFIFLPSAIYVSYKEVSNRTKKWTHFVGFFGTFFLSLSFLCKIMHWPGANILILLGIGLISLVFLPMIMINKLKDKSNTTPAYVFILAILGLILYVVAIFFKVMHWPGASMMILAGSVLLVFIAFPIYVVKAYKEETNVTDSFIFIVVAMVWFVVPTALISLNLSTNVLKSAYDTGNNLETDLSFVKERNDFLLAEMKDNSRAKSIFISADTLYEYIQSIKSEMVKFTNSEYAISADGGIRMQSLEEAGPYYGVYNKVLFNSDKRAETLMKLLDNFEKEAIAVSSDAEYNSIIREMAAFTVKPESNPYEEFLISLNTLSFLQLNASLVEQTALMELNQFLEIQEKQ